MKLYGVLSLKQSLDTSFGIKVSLESKDLNLVGMIPVFSTYESAFDYVDGDKNRVFVLNGVDDGEE